MASFPFLKFLHRSAWELWLPLPLIAALFWAAGNFTARQLLSRPFDSANQLQAEVDPGDQLTVNVLTINAEIDAASGVTTVVVRADADAEEKLTYQVASTQAAEVEAAIAPELGLSAAEVRSLISYRIKPAARP